MIGTVEGSGAATGGSVRWAYSVNVVPADPRSIPVLAATVWKLPFEFLVSSWYASFPI
jgi:hypothetical protein